MNEHACFCLFVRGSVPGRKFSITRGVCSVFVHEVVNNELCVHICARGARGVLAPSASRLLFMSVRAVHER